MARRLQALTSYSVLDLFLRCPEVSPALLSVGVEDAQIFIT